MPDLPIEQYSHYIGLDPGYKGAFGRMNAKGTSVSVEPMPMLDDSRELDTAALQMEFRMIACLPNPCIGIEWPTAFAGSFGGNPRDAEHFGRQKGTLDTMARMIVGDVRVFRIDPKTWKGRLGLDGKTIAGANDRAARLFDTYYPEYQQLIRGPRGGLLDGPMDALLIAHFLRTRSADGMKSIAAKFGKDSPEVMAFILGGGRRKRKLGRKTGFEI